MSAHDDDHGPSRRKVLECMTWAGTGVRWTVAGGVPTAVGLIDDAMAQEVKGFTFLQISDSHMGFDKPANPNAKGTLEEAIARVKSAPGNPAFMIHTGDISHLSKPSEFDDAEKIISQARLDVHYVPGEHDLLDDEQGKLYRERYGRGTRGAGWYSFDANGVHFVGLVNVANLKGGGLGNVNVAAGGLTEEEHCASMLLSWRYNTRWPPRVRRNCYDSQRLERNCWSFGTGRTHGAALGAVGLTGTAAKFEVAQRGDLHQ